MNLLTLDRTRSIAALVAAGATSLSLAVAAPATADRAADAPVTADDRVTVRGPVVDWFLEGGRRVDVLANDRDPNGDELAICRLEVPKNAPIVVTGAGDTENDGLPAMSARKPAPRAWARSDGEPGLSALYVAATSNRAGTYAVRYWACDHDYLTPATLTVTVEERPVVTAKVLPGRHRVRFTNPLKRPVRVLHGGPDQEDADGRFRLAPGRSKVLVVERGRMAWVAFVPGRRGAPPAGFGILRGLRPKR